MEGVCSFTFLKKAGKSVCNNYGGLSLLEVPIVKQNHVREPGMGITFLARCIV